MSNKIETTKSPSISNIKKIPSNFLNDSWCLYYHDPFDADWSKKSYKELYKIDTIQKFWEVNTLLEDKLDMGIFFLFREHIFPLWDDKYNKDGGALSMKILKTDCYTVWEDLAIKMLSENILKNNSIELSEEINGISVSPKKTFTILKIWTKTKKFSDPNDFKFLDKHHGKILFKSHQE
jgi:translation initiation factor 4E